MARERLYDGITPSGVRYQIRNLIGADQGTLTDVKKNKDNNGFNRMLASAIKFVGDNRKVDEDFVDKMLTNDRKDILVQLRQHTLNFRPTFDFTFEWAIGARGDKDASVQKQLQEYSVDFNEESFARTPFKWVRDKIAALVEEDPDYDTTKWPVLYESYSQMLQEHINQVFFAKYEGDEGMEISYQLLTSANEKKIKTIAENNMNSNVLLMRYAPKIKLIPKNEEMEPVVTTWDLNRADVLDLEDFRRQVRDQEGFIDTFLAIRNQKDASRQQRIDLVDTVDFFFPSRAI